MKNDLKLFLRLWGEAKSYSSYVFLAVCMIPMTAGIVSIEPMILKKVIDEGILEKNADIVFWMGLALLGFAFLRYLVHVVRVRASGWVVFNIVAQLRKKLMTHILNLKLSYHDRTLSGALVTRTTSDIDQLSESIGTGLISAIVDLFRLFACLVGIYWLDSILLLLSAGWILVVIFVVKYFSKALRTATLYARKKIAVMHAFAQESLYGAATVKVLASIEHVGSWYRERAKDYRNAQMRSVALDAGLFAILDGGVAVALGLSLWIFFQYFEQDVSPGVLIAFVRYQQEMFLPLKQLGSLMASLQSALTALTRIYEVLDCDEILSGESNVGNLKESIQFKNVSFSYSEGQPVLKDVCLKIPKGQSLAVVGRTGEGKSTFAKLILKLYDTYTGEIYWDEKELGDCQVDQLRRQIAVVPQDVVLFQGSLAFNVDPYGSQDRERLLAFFEEIGLSDWLESLPDGLDTYVLEKGENFSKGQRQVIALMRALFLNPSLLILDEATSSVDSHSEKQVQRILAKQTATTIIIAHRLNTIRHCDNIIVFENHRIADQGSWAELIKRSHLLQQFNSLATDPGKST